MKGLLNPLSHLVLDGGVHEGDVVKVRTRGEALELAKAEEGEFGWTSGSSLVSDNKNDVVIPNNHPSRPDGDGEDDKCDQKDELDDLLG